jgi:DNA-binding HxlR family transcriptional regulator
LQVYTSISQQTCLQCAFVAKSYNHYCPVAHALDLVGERWSLLVVRELIEHGPLRYSDLHCRLQGCGTNILASRLKDLERGGVIRRRRLPPPAAATVYELTDFGQELRPVMNELAHWGARSLGPPAPDTELQPGWLAGALRMAFPPSAPEVGIECRVDGELASFVDGQVREGPGERVDAVVEADRAGFFHLVVDRDLDAVSVRGSRAAVRTLLEALPERPTGSHPEPATVSAS